jgi:ribose transport system permease protein
MTMKTLALRRSPAMTPIHRMAAWCAGLPPAYTGSVLLLACAAFTRANLVSPLLLLLILRQAAPLGMVAIGQSLTMRCRSLDLSVGGVVAAVAYLLTSGVLTVPAPLALLLCLLLGAGVGVINGVLIVRLRASSVIVTLAVSMILSGIVIALSQFHAPGDAPAILTEFGSARIGGVPLVSQVKRVWPPDGCDWGQSARCRIVRLAAFARAVHCACGLGRDVGVWRVPVVEFRRRR